MAGMDDDPPRDPTILRPKPGGQRRVGAPAAEAPPAAVRPAETRAPSQPPPIAALQDFVATGRNKLLQAAAPLLILGARLQSVVSHGNVSGLRQQLIQAVKDFDARALSSGVVEDDVKVARYILCTFVDTGIFRTPWGNQWASQSLLSVFHHEASGGRRFFEILDRILGNPDRYLDLLELQYFCLALGFEGRYRDEADGKNQLLNYQDRLLTAIRPHRASIGPELSPHWMGVDDRRRRLVQLVPWWLVALAGVVILTGYWLFLHERLLDRAAPIAAQLAGQGITLDYAPPRTPAPPSRLKQLLAPQEQAGRLTVEEFGNRSVVTLISPELFRSGSAALVDDFKPVIDAVGAAAEQVPGRIDVVGHTDDQPVKSLRYTDNFQLSLARAETVAGILRSHLSQPSRVASTGVGSAQPRYQPQDTPENRSRNRRVEIVHAAGSTP